MTDLTAVRPRAGRTNRAGKSGFRPDIEGLRAIAVLAVLVYHLGASWLPGGFVGVDVFFVISGFLITSHLVREWNAEGRISLPRFYARRMLRLLPAATLTLLGTAAATVLFVPRSLWQQIGTDIAGSAAYVVNWIFAARSVDYLAEDAVQSPVQHFWSLAVEEQYYVIWPLLIIAAGVIAVRSRLGVRSAVGWAAALVIAVSFGAALIALWAGDVTAYFSTVTRLWELAAGALVAVLAPLLRRSANALLTRLGYYVGIGMILLSLVVVNGEAAWPGPMTLLPVVGSALAIACGGGDRRSIAERVVSTPPFVWVGGLSYSLYLWHWPVIVIAGYVFPESGLKVAAACAVLSVALAWASGRFVENPIRFSGWARRRSRNGLGLGISLGAVSALAGLALVLAGPNGALAAPADAKPDGAAALESPIADTPAAVLDAQPAWVLPDPALAEQDVPELYADGCQQSQTSAEVKTCAYGDKDADRDILIVGDSKAGQWLPALDAIGQDEGYRVVVMTKSACPFTDAPTEQHGEAYPSCDEWNRAADRAVQKLHADVLVTSMVSSRAHTEGSEQKAVELMTDGLSDKLQRMQKWADEVVVLGDTPHPGQTIYRCVSENPDDVSECTFDRTVTARSSALGVQRDAVTRLGGSVVEAGTGATQPPADGAPLLLDLSGYLCPPQTAKACPAIIGNALVYRQGSHITATYVATMTEAIRSELDAAGVTAG